MLIEHAALFVVNLYPTMEKITTYHSKTTAVYSF